MHPYSLLNTDLRQCQVWVSMYVVHNTINRLTQLNLSYILYVGIIMQKYKCISYTFIIYYTINYNI